MTKRSAFLKHLLLSAAVVAVALTVIFKIWYPYPYFRIAGAERVLQILIGVDLILGPLLTLVLYKPGKKWLWFDMSFIAAIQIAALIYGLTTIYGQRPYYSVFAVDRFVLLTANKLKDADLPEDVAATRPTSGPLYAVARLPEDVAERQALLFELLDGAPDIEYRPYLWESFDSQRAYLQERLKPLVSYAGRHPAVDAFIGGKTTEELAGLLCAPIQGTAGAYMTLIISAETLAPVDVIDVDLFESEEAPDSGG